ncbi:MAG TPA: hypothetical protein VNH84_11235, partial [Candidatus Saccharimonadales bacterium]|nr:hypothetical protein [Candidatus Saccharimonadales bacterium]
MNRSPFQRREGPGVVAAIFLLLAAADAAMAGPTRPLAQLPSPPASGGGNSFASSLTPDGRFVVFVSHANNLVTNDDSGCWLDLFLRDRVRGLTLLVSVNTNGVGGGDGDSVGGAISTNGNWVAFESSASNLVPGDTNGFSDVFVRDLSNGVTHLVSLAGDGGTGANGPSGAPLLSADGRWVFFESLASNLVENDLNQTQDIFARDRWTDTTLLVSADANGPGTNSGPAHSAAITPDGRFVAFIKAATNAIAAGFSAGDVYVRDMQRGTTTWASSNAPALFYPPLGSYLCLNPVLSADGRFVVFKVIHKNTTTGQVLLLRRDLLSGQTDAIHSNVPTQSWAQVSADGRWVAYDTRDGIELWDAQSASNRLVCTNVNDPIALYRACSLPALNADGSRLAYVVRTSPNGVASLYAQDLPAGSPRLVSVTTNGLPASVTDAWPPLLSADGSVLVFDALDERLVPGDSNLAGDVFAADENAGALELISRRHEERPGLTPPLFSLRHPRSLSADGRVAVLGAFDRALSDMDTNGLLDLYVRDQGRDTLHFPGDARNRALDLVVSANGRYSAYGLWHASPFQFFSAIEYVVMWTDLLTASNRLVTGRGYRARFPVFDSLPLAISADGTRVAFQTLQSPELLVGPFADLNGVADVYLQDIATGSNQLVSVNRDG